jgi:isoquinoline 1-oxidoreductase beta subunit
MTQQFALSRRAALQGLGGLVIGLYLPEVARAQTQTKAPHAAPSGAAPEAVVPPQAAASEAVAIPVNAFVRVGADDTVTVIVKHIEFGQGPFTGLATIVAEELDADWATVRAEHAPSNPELYKNSLFGAQGTGGSSAVSNSYEELRRAGATARAMLVQAAAQAWNVAPAEIETKQGVLSQPASGRSARFGAFAEAAGRLPVPSNVPLKDPANFRLIGRDDAVTKLDSAAKTNGTAQFTLDIRESGMLTVVVGRPPLFGAKVGTFDANEALKVPGVVDVKAIPSGVAVYATSTWPALKARDALSVSWDESGAEKRGSAELINDYRALAETPGRVAGVRGNAEAALASAEKVIESEYVFPYLAHAPMEPLDGFLRWDGQHAVARFGSQLQTGDHKAIADVLGLPMESVEIETMLAGGSFGRRAQQTTHFAAELAEAAKAIGPGRPVKVVWTREDDIRGGYYRPLVVHRLRGALREGKIYAWANTIVGQSIMKGSPSEKMIKDGIDPLSVEGSKEIPYEVPHFRCDLHTTDVGVPVLWWRSVGHTHTGYAVECFVDELLQAAGADPVAGRLAIMDKAPREAGVLRAVAELARWSGPGPVEDRARGVAVVKSFGTYVAEIAEVSAGKEGPRVHKVWCAVDCGVPVNPDVIRAQMEGGIGYGLGHALFNAVEIVEGRPVPGNFDTYRSLRINEMPEVEVVVLRSTEKPTGVGEPGVPPIAPAVANAMARLGLKRPHQLPIISGAA